MQKSDGQVLHAIGLSPAAARCYVLLISELPIARPAPHIAERAELPYQTVHRAVKELARKGFAEELDRLDSPRKTYRAVPLSRALEAYALYQRRLALPLLQKWAESGKIHR